MKRDLDNIVYPLIAVSIILTPAPAYSFRPTINGSAQTDMRQGENVKSIIVRKITERIGKAFKRVGDYVKENPDDVIKRGSEVIDSMAPGVGTITEKTGRWGKKVIDYSHKRGYTPSTGFIQGKDYQRRR